MLEEMREGRERGRERKKKKRRAAEKQTERKEGECESALISRGFEKQARLAGSVRSGPGPKSVRQHL